MEFGCGNLILKINLLKEEIEADRAVQIKEKLDKNQKKLRSHIRRILSAPLEVNASSGDESCEAPRLGIGNLFILDDFVPGSEDEDLDNTHEVIFAKSTVLPKIQGIPKYTTWVFLERNQRMVEAGNEALICSDTEEDTADVEEKRDFSEGEDRILWMAFKEHGSDDNVAEVVSHFIGGNPAEILERFNELKLNSEVPEGQGTSGGNLLLEKSLSTALDSFDNLFCRRCLIFDCRMHGCGQNLVYPREKPLSLSEPEAKKPCSDQCYLLVRPTTLGLVEGSQTSSLLQTNCNIYKRHRKGSKVFSSGEKISRDDVGIGSSLESANREGASGVLSSSTILPISQPAHEAKRKVTDDDDSEASESFNTVVDPKLKKFRALEHPVDDHTTSNPNDFGSRITSSRQVIDVVQGEVNDINRRREGKQPAISLVGQRNTLFSSCEWKPLEKDLYLKGLEIFGRNSCLITRNLLSGLKTCSEVFNYMHNNRASMTHDMDIARSSEDNARADSDNLEQEVLMRSRSKLVRKRGKTRRLKFSSKSNGHTSNRKKISDGKQQMKQYTPCTCEFICGKDCPCQNNGSCCEKYCGCPKSCKIKYRGCYCRSQCRRRQCPCFAANRECDPDVCRNCWVSCGGDELGEPPKRGDGQCGNMRILLRQQQSILLGKSDVTGWGVFIKNSVNRHDYLGEYTGELISPHEADKRGNIYDRRNSSFLFNLNDEYVLDACREGDKLKFANHSSKPNCYCKIMLVGGDHRVGIFANQRIEAGEELFYDYQYGAEEAPDWARKPESSKKDDAQPSQSRPSKHQSC